MKIFVTALAQILCYLQDAGETNGLLSVLQELQQRGEPFELIVSGTAADMVKQHSWLQATSCAAIDKSWPRDRLLAPDELEKIVGNRSPSVFLTGVAFALEGQLLEAFRAKGAAVYAFWDHLNEQGADSYFTTANQVALQADWILTPHPHFSFPRTLCVGQPGIERAAAAIQEFSSDALKRIYKIDPNRLTLVYFAGYGALCEEAYRFFLACIEGLDANVLVQPHPKIDPSTFADPRISVLQGVGSLEAMAMADVVLCHQSSASFQALAAKKPLLYLVPSSQSYDNAALQKKLALRVACVSEFQQKLQSVRTMSQPSFFEEMGIPEKSKERIANLLLEKKQ